MRIGIHTGATRHSDNAIDELIAFARETAEDGLDFWMGQAMDVDALTALAVVGRAVPGLRVGTAIVPTYPRHPFVMAMQALTVQAATGGSFTLGIGLSHQMVIEGSYGISFSKPIRHMREYLEILMPVLRTGKADFAGQELAARTLGPMRVVGAEPPAVVIAALGTQMLNLAGRMTDGTTLWMVGPKTLADHTVPTVTKAAEQAGRPAPRVIVGLPVSVTADPEAARTRAVTSFGYLHSIPSYKAMLDREGVDGPADVAIVGDEEVVADSLLQLGQVGATDLSVMIFGSDEERRRTMTLLSELAKA